jgi:DNA invertase Pin-like site-specific DNA recombinase
MRALRAIGLVRVSQRQGDASEHSPEVQVRGMAKHADDGGLLLDPRDIWDENIDGNGKVRKVSGGWDLSDRPKLAAAIEAIERGTHQVILAERFDRLFRNLDVQREAIRRVEAAGGRLETVKQGAISHATAEAELHANIDGVIAQYTKRTAKERSWAAVEVAIEEGKWSGPVPPGYVKDDTGALMPATRVTVQIVRQAFERRAGGATFGEVRAFLSSNGIERTVSGVRRMLASRAYLGEIHFGGHTPNLNAHKAIIGRALFDRVQQMVVPAGRKAKSERLLARLGVLRCETCGGRMSASSGGSGTYPTYRCASQDCGRPVTIGAEPVEREVIDAVIAAARDKRGRAVAAERARQAAEEAERAQASLEAAIRVLSDFGDEQAAHARLAELRAERDRTREQANRLAAFVEPSVTVDAAAVFAHGTLAERRALIRTRVESVLVAPGRSPDRVTIQLLGE